MRSLNNSEEMIADFSLHCDEMANSKFILAEGKISNILRTIASSSILYRLFDDILSDFDFGQEFDKCKIPNSFNRVSLKFPVDKRKYIAVVATLLVEFDAKRRDLYSFLNEYYTRDGDIAAAYQAFVRTAITGLKSNVLYLLEEFEGDWNAPEAYFDDERRGMVGDATLDSALELVNEIHGIINTVAADNTFNVSEREDIMILLDGLSNAVITRNPKLIKISWIGLKNTMRLRKMKEETGSALGKRIDDFLDIL